MLNFENIDIEFLETPFQGDYLPQWENIMMITQWA